MTQFSPYRTPQQMRAATIATHDPATVIVHGSAPTETQMRAAIDAATRQRGLTDLERVLSRARDERITAIVRRDDWENPEIVFHFRASRALAGLRMLAKRRATDEVLFHVNGRRYRLAGPAFRPDNDATPLLTDRRPNEQAS